MVADSKSSGLRGSHRSLTYWQADLSVGPVEPREVSKASA
jgi:hypothetical protein